MNQVSLHQSLTLWATQKVENIKPTAKDALALKFAKITAGTTASIVLTPIALIEFIVRGILATTIFTLGLVTPAKWTWIQENPFKNHADQTFKAITSNGKNIFTFALQRKEGAKVEKKPSNEDLLLDEIHNLQNQLAEAQNKLKEPKSNALKLNEVISLIALGVLGLGFLKIYQEYSSQIQIPPPLAKVIPTVTAPEINPNSNLVYYGVNALIIGGPLLVYNRNLIFSEVKAFLETRLITPYLQKFNYV